MDLPASFGKSWDQAQRSWTILRTRLNSAAFVQFGLLADRPEAKASNKGIFYYATDEKELAFSNGEEWAAI